MCKCSQYNYDMAEKDIFIPQMPEVDVRPKLGGIFERARAAAAETTVDKNNKEHHQVIIVTPGAC